ncbi:MAG: hypothetical protein CVT63_06945 [Candidatus Anoxymicrobium japonicum]|uniref:ATP synthase protein I n=1 Tax=Candidatus Anoxymicrobium japonicum TaxID=2013648 RepID=A0A2N3G4H9_9ACTN|nr:MAG: hypothetical protein CVT63_06945 [Candidatus Anoxymicrobium japonicum]
MNQANDVIEWKSEIQVDELYDRYSKSLAQSLSVAGGGVIPVCLIISAVFAGWRGFTGAFVGGTVASLYTIVAIACLKWALSKPMSVMLVILMATMWGRLIAVGAALYGLSRIPALNGYALIFCFLALFLAYTILETVLAWRIFGAMFKKERHETGLKE